MAAKTKAARLESEIEKCRADSNWSKAVDLARQVSTKSSQTLELLAILVLGESRLERYLLENPPTEANIGKACEELHEAQQQLLDVLKGEPKPGLKQETLLLLAKLQYTMGDYNGALARYDEVKLDTITVESISNRRLKLVGEAFAIKGLCLEKIPLHSPTGQIHYTKQGLCLEKIPLNSTSRYKQVERDEQVLRCFERSGDISILQLQDLADRGKGTPTTVSLPSAGIWNMVEQDTAEIGACVETAIQRSPILYIRNGELSKGIGRFRELLRAVETRAIQGLRQTLARQLAEVLLRGVCETTYQPIVVDEKAKPNKPRLYTGDRYASGKSQSRSNSRSRSVSPQPKMHNPSVSDRLREKQALAAMAQARARSSSLSNVLTAMTVPAISVSITPAENSLFVPQNQNEEILLLLLISESMATRDAILNRSHEHTEARLHTFHNTTAVYDLLTIALVKRAQYNMLSETFERAMKFSFDEFHIWYQFALSLICAQKYQRAMLVLKECMRLATNNPVPFLHAARLCYDHLHLIDDGIKYAEESLELTEDKVMKARALVTLGVGYSLKAEEARLQVTRQEYQRKALNTFYRAQSLDSNDYLSKFHVALQSAILRQIPEALKYVHEALRLRNDHIHSLHLLALLLSAQKQHSNALQLIEAAIAEYPDDFNLLFTKSKLEEEVYGVEEALHTCKHMLTLWKENFEAALENEHRGTGLLDKVTADHRSLVQLTLSELSDRDSGSMRAESMAASRVEQALSEVASSMASSFVPKQGPHQTWILQAQIWLHLAELYLSLNRLDEAQACINEAGTIFPVSHLVSYMRGRLFEKKNDLYDAKSCYENAAAINPSHVKSLQHLGLVLQQLGNYRLGEKVLRDAVNADPTCAESWELLGRTLQLLEEFDAATECLLTAVELESSSPIVAFPVIPRALV